MSKVKEDYVFELDGELFAGSDGELTGRQVRTKAGLDPAGDFRIIEIHGRYTSAVGLEDPVILKKGEKRVFRSFESDRDFAFEVNERGWVWGATTISDDDVRAIGKIDEDCELVVAIIGADDIIVPRGGVIDVNGKGVERIFSRRIPAPSASLHVNFVINGEPVQVKGKPSSTLISLLEIALKDSENTGQDVSSWQVTDEPGNLLDVTKTLKELGICDGAVLLASLKAGAAG